MVARSWVFVFVPANSIRLESDSYTGQCCWFSFLEREAYCLIEILRRTGSLDFHQELVLPRHACCVLSCLHCNGHSLLLSSYLSRNGRIENPACCTCLNLSQDTFHLILHCPATDSLRRSLFGDSLSLYDLWSRTWKFARLLGLHGLPPCLHLWEGVV